MEKKKSIKKQKRRIETQKRSMFMLFVLSSILFAITLRLGYIMIFKADKYSAMALEQWTSEVEIQAKRGKILDRNGIELAVSANVYRVDLDLNYMRTKYKNTEITNEDIALKLSEVLDMTQEQVLEKLNLKLTSGVPASSTTLARKIEKEQADKVKELNIAGVMVYSDTQRYYPNNSFLSHVLGSINGDGVGITGVEAVYNSQLSGIPGVRITESDGWDRDIPYTESKFASPINGKDVYLTIDEKIQYFAEKVAEKGLKEHKADAVTVIVTNPNNGEILAMSNKPDFNPNEPYSGKEKFKGETNDEKLHNMWKNRSVENSFEPGSIFKIITGAAAVEEGVAGGDETYFCSGGIKIGNGYINCWKPGGHGTQSFDEVLQNSCNPAIITIAQKLGRETLNEYIYNLGFGVRSGVDLPGESSGIIKETSKITDLDLGTISMGQTDAVNAIQFMAAMNAVINGGTLIQPHVMREISHNDSTGVRVIDDVFVPKIKEDIISEETSKRMNIALESTVRLGSGKPSYIEGYGIGGKSGTGEKVDPNTGSYSRDAGYVSSFVGFAPYDNPQVSIMISVDNPKAGSHFGGEVAAPLAHDLFTEIFNYLDFETLSADNESVQPTIPDIRGMKVDEAKKVLEDEKLQFIIKGEEKFVTSISPLPGYQVEVGSKIVLETGSSLKYDNDVIVPKLKGYSKEEVKNIMSKIGLRVTFEGEGVVTKQNINSGEVVKSGSTIKCTLEEVEK